MCSRSALDSEWLEAINARNTRRPIGQAGKIILVPFCLRRKQTPESILKRERERTILTAMDDEFLPQPPCEMVRMLLAALYKPEMIIDNAAKTRNSTLMSGIWLNTKANVFRCISTAGITHRYGPETRRDDCNQTNKHEEKLSFCTIEPKLGASVNPSFS